METRVFLVRNAVTDWHRARRVLGARDIPLNAEGVAQAQEVARTLASLHIVEVLSSPLLRAVQTAEIAAAPLHIDVARDPRLTDFRVGAWEGASYDEAAASPAYARFAADPLTEKLPGGEDLRQIRDRAVAAIEQAVEDVPAGEGVAVVTHAGIVRALLVHYLGAELTRYHRVRVSPASVSVLAFGADRSLPRVLAVNWRGALPELL